ncbi:ParB/RepB/Spo0J family partition protein [Methyloversatilis sp. XJ19-13]|uniref:ParB/RepB/Spo0J family partition protein n=1 Tax=Methyloversatilis sp. XJ19-13 TaxID=2963430 RepID=UPI00211BB08F|nr:ParB/RepB/Spo0J family partition protein [Methyloversatilis sp. XJ19-13]MCQ9372851.1 ParB/RepB/Spo0J family partition protein [Methyloversatilis sp. XJ19-13]
MTTTTEKKTAPVKAVKKAPVKAKRPELASVASVVLVPLADLVEVSNIREAMDEEGIAELARDIEARGLLQPIIVTPARGNKYQIVAGHRRTAAVRRTAATAVPAVVIKLNGAETTAAQLAENVQRENLSTLDEGRALLALKKEGMNLAQLAELVNKSRSWVCKRIACVEGLPWPIEELIREGVTEDPEIILALKELTALDWWATRQAIDRLKAGEENRDSLRELVRKAKEPKADLVAQMDGAEGDGDGDTAGKLRQTDADASPQARAAQAAERDAMEREQRRGSRINLQCATWQLLSLATLDEEPTDEEFEIYAELEPEARAYWCEVINDALGGDLFEKMMKRAAVAALEEEPDVLPVMLWVAMQPKPLPEREEDVLKGFLQGFRKVCVSHAKRET